MVLVTGSERSGQSSDFTVALSLACHVDRLPDPVGSPSWQLSSAHERRSARVIGLRTGATGTSKKARDETAGHTKPPESSSTTTLSQRCWRAAKGVVRLSMRLIGQKPFLSLTKTQLSSYQISSLLSLFISGRGLSRLLLKIENHAVCHLFQPLAAYPGAYQEFPVKETRGVGVLFGVQRRVEARGTELLLSSSGHTHPVAPLSGVCLN